MTAGRFSVGSIALPLHRVVGQERLLKETNKIRAGKAASSEAAIICHAGLRWDEKKRKRRPRAGGPSSLSLSVVLKYSDVHSLFFPPQRWWNIQSESVPGTTYSCIPQHWVMIHIPAASLEKLIRHADLPPCNSARLLRTTRGGACRQSVKVDRPHLMSWGKNFMNADTVKPFPIYPFVF